MKLNKIKIHNFRGILDQEIYFHPYTLAVGANNAGKSTLIDALRCFYEKDGYKFKSERDFPHIQTLDQESWIELEFDLTTEEFSSLADDYKEKSNSLKVKKYFQTTIADSDGKSLAGIIVGYDNTGNPQDTSFYGAKNVQSGKFGDIIYVPAVSRVDDHTKLTGPSALRDLITSVLKDVVGQSKVFEKFSHDFESFAGKIKTEKSLLGTSLETIEQDIDAQMKEWGPKFKLLINEPSTDEIIKTLFDYEFDEKGQKQSVGQFGSGFQRQFIYSLIQVVSKYSLKNSKSTKKDFTPNFTLLLFEEPEAFLHPPQQETMARNLREMSISEGRQVICSTHSSNFVSNNSSDLTSIIRVRRSSTGDICFYQIDSSAWANLVGDNQQIIDIAKQFEKMKKDLDEDDSKADMEAIKYFLWLNPGRSGMFFADLVLLVEGPTEVGLINRLISENKIKAPFSGLYVIDCMGKYNIHRFMNLLSRMGLDHVVIHDVDGGDGKREGHEELNRLIQNSRSMFTKKILLIEKDLEALLGVLKTSKHRKPQHMLFMYDQGKINQHKINEFCRFIETVFA